MKRKHYRALIALLKVPELGKRRISKLLEKTREWDESPEEIFRLNIPDLLKIDGIGEGVARNIAGFNDWDSVERILDQTAKSGANLISLDDDNYPPLLKHIYDPPILLWVKGNTEVLKSDGLAVIGTRRPGRYGSEQAITWSKMIAEAGFTVNSGLAYGVDTLAHREAINCGGKSIAVLGSGIDVIYPFKNRSLVRDMIEKNSAVITEYPPGTQPDAMNFPDRNRIVSGISHGVLVIESGVKGGSMITARSALDQNREVFVIPHQLGRKFGEGCNFLIQTGQGKLVQSINDILEEIHPDHLSISMNKLMSFSSETTGGIKWKSLNLDEEESTLCKIIEEGEMHIDHLCEKTNKPVFELHSTLLNLELKGAVVQKAGKYYKLC